ITAVAMATRTARQKNLLPPCYYEGFLEKRSFKDKTSRKLWTCLCGNTLFFFNDKKDANYVETLDLRGLVSVSDDSSPDRNLDAARLNLQMKDGNVKFTVPSAEARELWKGFIHSVTELSVPSSLNLLPGQVHMLKEAVEREKQRTKAAPPAPSPSLPLGGLLPACYHNISRLEAELLLEREAKRGNLLLRPRSDSNSFAVTTKQDLNGSVFRHYRVTRKHEGGFIIDVDNPTLAVKSDTEIFCPLINACCWSVPQQWRETSERNPSCLQRLLLANCPHLPPPPPPPRTSFQPRLTWHLASSASSLNNLISCYALVPMATLSELRLKLEQKARNQE
uniref:Uncharacterized protein n=1 Tax=Mola mola TaxID=94237 RepID=A0A3Q3VZG9_MOLML